MADALLQAANLKRLQAGETLFMRGAPADGIFAVLEGSLRVSGMTVDGKEAILSIVEAPQWLGEIALFDGMPRTHDVVAESAVALLHVPRLALEALQWVVSHGKNDELVAIAQRASLPAASLATPWPQKRRPTQ